MKRANIWTNKDGLAVGFGPRQAEDNSAASVAVGDGHVKTVIMKLVGSGLAATPTAAQLANTAVIPAGSNIKSVRVVVDTAFSGGTSVDVGGYTLADADDDENGFIAALLTATLVAGYDETYTAPASNKGGAYIGTKLANSVKVVPSYNTSGYSAGVATVTIEYEAPAN
jgi:hypothetical protein